MQPTYAGRHGPGKAAGAGGLLLALGLLSVEPAASAGLTSAPIDASLFRDGEVRHLTGSFGPWTVLCDEVTRLRQRYCSLRGAIVDEKAATVAWLTVSTGDDGRPAALVELPLGTRVATGVNVEQPRETCRARVGAGASRFLPCTHRLGITECDAVRCYAVWTLNEGELAAFNAGTPLRLAYQQVRVLGPFPASIRETAATIVGGAVTTQGFASAVAASMR